MQQHPAHEKLRLLRRVLRDGEPVSRICEEAKIPRKTFYQWKRRYVSGGERGRLSRLQRRERLRRGSLVGTRGFRAALLNVIVRHPNWSLRRCAKTLRDRGYTASHMSVARQLRGLGLESIPERETFSRLHSFRKRVIDRYERRHRWLLPEARKMMVEEALRAGRAVGEICRDYRVSRKTFYKWKARYLASIDDVTRLPLVASQADRHLRGSRHPLSLPSPVRDRILGVIAAKPALSYREIARVVGGVSHRGVGNFLLREGLNTKERRLAWAAGRVVEVPMGVQLVTAWVGRLKQVLEQFIPTRAPAPPFAKAPEGARPPFFKTLQRLSIPILFSLVIFFLLFQWGQFLGTASSTSQALGFGFASLALTMGTAFFLYSLKYYFTLAVVLSFSREASEPATSDVQEPPTSDVRFSKARSWLGRLFGIASSTSERTTSDVEHSFTSDVSVSGGLEPDLTRVTLERHPMISVHIPMYNEPKVAERVLRACTGFSYQGPYEVIIADDSTDETTAIVQEFAARWNAPPSDFTSDVKGIPTSDVSAFGRPQIKVIHRETREGFKGGALREALKATDPRAEFVVVFDADFVPYPDTLELFLKYFQVNSGSLNPKTYTLNPIAAIQGYQWHVLNKSENWITRGVRSEYAGSYVIERSGAELYGGLKQIAGSVYMIRRDLLETFGWGTSLTEDFELTLRLYGAGYRVVYTPYIQAPAECASTLKRLIRQRMRWAEGHSFNIRRMFARLLFGGWSEGTGKNQPIVHLPLSIGHLSSIDQFSNSTINGTWKMENGKFLHQQGRVWLPSPLSLSEKLEFLYLSPYYLQAAFFLLGTLSWLISETIFKARLPFWTNVWGWSLVLTNLLSLPLMNLVGLFLEEAEERDFTGILSFVLLSYILVPFQAYASIKGFLENQEGPWFRTPKTGKITDILSRGRFFRFIAGILPGKQPSVVSSQTLWNLKSQISNLLTTHYQLPTTNNYLSLATANNRFNNFKIRPKHIRWIGKLTLAVLLISSLLVTKMAFNVPLAEATAGTQIKTVEFFLYQYNSGTEITAGNGIDNTSWGATCGASDSDPSVTINIPESGVTFRSAVVEYRSWQSAGSGTAVSDYDIQFCHSGGTTASDSGSGTVSTSSAENNMILVRLDATSPMQSGSNTYYFDARLSGATRNLDSLKLILTYEYDQTSATQLKTVYFYGNQQTGASSTTDLDAVINPNLTEGGLSVKDSFAVFKGQVNGADNTISGSFAASGTCGSASAVAVADGALDSVYGYIVLFDMTNTINLTTDNCIRHAVSVATFARSIEWVITFEYSYYSQAEANDLIHTKTVRYMMGTLDSPVGGSQTTVGTQQINLPEDKPSNPFTSAYLHYYIQGMDAAATITTCISTAANCTGTTSSQASIDYGNIREQSGGPYALDDVTGFFNTNFTSNPQTFTANVNDLGGDASGISAEVVITYKFNADNSSTIVKTVWFWVGQETLSRTNTAFDQTSESGQTNWNTYWPETGTKTFRNGAVYASFNFNGTTGVSTSVSGVITIDDTAVGGTDSTSTSFGGTGENVTGEMMAKISTQVPATFGAQTDINFSLSTNSTTLPLFRSPISYFTVETATSLAPEFALILIPFAILVPVAGKFYFGKKKRFVFAERSYK